MDIDKVNTEVVLEEPKNIPTAATSMTLVQLSHHVPTFRKKDKRRTAQVNAQAGAQRKAASVSKKYLDCAELSAVETVKSDHYDFHIASTIPWLDGGIRGLSNRYLQEYMKESSEWENLFNQKVDDFGEVYTWEASKEEARMGALYDQSLYPDWEVVKRGFGVEVKYIPLAQASHFSEEIQQEAMDYLKEEYTKGTQQLLEAGTADIIQRVLKPVLNLVKMIDYDDHDKPSGFRDTLIPNVEEVLLIMRRANITNDATIESARVELERILGRVSCDALRESGTLRAATKQEVQAVIESLPTLN